MEGAQCDGAQTEERDCGTSRGEEKKKEKINIGWPSLQSQLGVMGTHIALVRGMVLLEVVKRVSC